MPYSVLTAEIRLGASTVCSTASWSVRLLALLVDCFTSWLSATLTMTARLCYDSLKVDLLHGFMCCLDYKTDQDRTHWKLGHMLKWTRVVQSLWEQSVFLPLWLFSTISTRTTQLFWGGTHSYWAKQIKHVSTHAGKHTESIVFSENSN